MEEINLWKSQEEIRLLPRRSTVLTPYPRLGAAALLGIKPGRAVEGIRGVDPGQDPDLAAKCDPAADRTPAAAPEGALDVAILDITVNAPDEASALLPLQVTRHLIDWRPWKCK